ncbi:hypothetical protein HZS38_08910 [Xenorhabdus nematophila]|uniref:phage tail fiber protein n=1 Tax=Xenorhabdus nematophila TaxID=628 RepID=UPI000541E7AA|nr:tail fiber protein [Xenorhabdus nematophila]CEF31382.1 NgrE (modular protein) (modular protein) [Xenorhabdus nematophila str. Websteri]AYA40519.1 hypothetical protein D3790_08780 [Xenorhabdus nematophila]MBA0019255.1 hypothetical protein [Xenorhabdus nematophila]MCB4427079.1 hypothetical protein [Xenorhabdus nematophila]QNJ38154.1 hypothetical protein H8F46_08625 [Xenorhabdus nematophila]
MYSQGTISTVSGSAIVRGTGTKFIANINGVAPAQLILIQSGNGNLLHMIQAVNSDTELILADNAKSTLNNVTYQIQTTVPDSASDGARHIVAINSYIVNFLQNMDKWMSQNGVVDVTLPNGQTVSLQSIRALQAAVEGKLDKNKNGADIQDTAAFVENLGLVKTVEQAENAYPKTGGTVNGEVHADRLWTKTSLNLGSGIVGDRHGMALTSKDDASFEGNNVEIRSWNGIGFKSTYNNPQGHSTVFVNTRNGDISTRGTIRMGNGTVMALGQNCWRDNNGFIKQSSPIIEIHSDGKFTTNDESEGATVERLSEGVYLIKNVLGFNADAAWGGVDGGVEIPMCKNKLPLIWVDYKVLPDGAIKIMTYHREHPNAPAFAKNIRQGYSDGDLIDIPVGRSISVRVQMPADSVWNVRQGNPQRT